MDQAGLYLPQDRRIAISEGRELPTHSRGAALMADISGFTPMSEAFTQEYGTHRGAEELTHRLNHFFEFLVYTIQSFGGSVLNFSGDAATCWFEDDDGFVAVACALEVQRQFSTFPGFRTDKGQHFDVKLKVSIAAGEAERFVAGSDTVQLIDVMMGSPFVQLSLIDRLLGPGEVGIPQDLIQSSMPPSTVRTQPSGPAIAVFAVGGVLELADRPLFETLPELAVEVARPWILPRVYERITLGHLTFMADLRLAVVFFLKFEMTEGDGPQATERARGLITHFQQVLHSHGGSLLQVIVGDKGTYIYGSFGAPQAHENDPTRAMKAMMEIRDHTPANLGLRSVKVGLSRGQIYAGTYGSEERKTFGVLGNEVNLAARLMEGAPNGAILVTAALERVSRDEFDFRALGTRDYKGFHNPIPVFQLERVQSRAEIKKRASSTSHPLIGRESELALLLPGLDAAIAGGSTLALVEGEPGIGKSRLTQEVMSQARSRGFLVLTGETSLQETSTSFFGWRPMLRQFFGLEPYSSEDADEEVVLASFAGQPALVDRAPLLNPLLAVNFAESELTRQLTGENRLNTLIDFLVVLLQARDAESPLLAVIDDVQWLDQGSWRLLEGLADRLKGVFFLLGSRVVDDGTEADLERMKQRPGLVRLKLGPLTPRAAVALVKSQLNLTSMPDEVEQFIQAKAEGNPFFSLELAAALRDTGLLVVAQGVATLSAKFSGWTNLPFPDNLQGVVASRIDSLAPLLQDLLKVASVFGMEFTLTALEGIYAQQMSSPQEFEAGMNQAQKLDLILEDLESSVQAYLFRHVVIQQVSYGRLLFQQKQELHHRVAQWLEQQYSDNLTPYVGLLAYHWKQAQQPTQTLRYTLAAGHEALKQFSNHEAIALLTEALELDKTQQVLTAEDRGRAAIALGEAYLQNSDYPGAITWMYRGLDELGSGIPRNPVVLTTRILQELAVQLRHRRTGKYGTRKDAERSTLVCRTLISLVEVLATVNRPLDAVFCTLLGTNLAEDLGLKGEIARAYSYCSVLLQFSGLPVPAGNYARRCEEALNQDIPVGEQILPLLGLGFYASGSGNFGGAQALFSRLGTAAVAVGDHRRHRDSVHFQALVGIIQGNWPEARRLLPIFSKMSIQKQDFDNVLLGDTHELHICLLSGTRIDESKVASIASRIVKTNTPAHRGPIASVLALAARRLGNIDLAREFSEATLLELKRKPTKIFSFYMLFVSCAQYWLEEMEISQQKKAAATKFLFALNELRSFSEVQPIAIPPYSFLCGHYLLSQNKIESARKIMHRGLAFARSSGMEFDKNRLEMALASLPGTK